MWVFFSVSLCCLLFTSELFEINHIRTIYHMFIAVLLIFCMSTLAVDYIDQGRSVWHVCVVAPYVYDTATSQTPWTKSNYPKAFKNFLLTSYLFFVLIRSLPLSLPAPILIWQQKDRIINPSENISAVAFGSPVMIWSLRCDFNSCFSLKESTSRQVFTLHTLFNSYILN